MRDYSFGNFLRELRVRQGLSQVQLGALVGVSDKAVSKWENGTSKPQSRILFRLSELLGVTVDELLTCKYRSMEDDSAKGVFAMKKQLWNEAEKMLYEKYGEKPDIRVMNRWYTETAELENSDAVVAFDLAAKIRQTTRERGGHVRFTADVHSSFAAYIMGASDINPLPPHYFCPVCKKIEFSDEVPMWWELPARRCACGREYERDGYNIPAESVRTTVGSVTLLSVILPIELHACVRELMEGYFSDRIMVTFKRKDNEDFERVVFLPDERFGMSHGDIMPLEEHLKLTCEHPAVSLLLKEDMKLYAELEKETNTSFDRIPFASPEVLEALVTGNTEGIPEFGTRFIRNVIGETKPKTFTDLFRIMGLTHGTGVYINNAADLIAGGMPLGDVIAYREDVFLYVQERMREKGFYDTGYAYRIMRAANRGTVLKNGLPEELLTHLREIGCEPWFIESIAKVRFLFPMGDGAYFMKYSLILMWYKLHYPEAFAKIMHTD